MNKKQWLLGLSLAGASMILGACTAGNAESKEAIKNEVITVGSQSSDADIWRYIADSEAAKEMGITLEIEEIDGGPQLNMATVDEEVDVNAFQSWAYLQSFNEESGDQLTAFATTYLEPMGIYSSQYTSLDELPNGAEVAIADNPSNASRGLLLLQAAGLITLTEDFDSFGTPSDIIENPQNLVFTEIDDTTGPRVLPDVAIALISNSIALEGGLNVLDDSLFYEEVSEDTKQNVNILVTQPEKANDEAILKLGEIYHSEEVQAYIKDEFGGTKVPVQLEIEELEK
ncbi:MetQ/NlpA family ABC transporter substrate-binding protein [Jeotgalibaca sp. A127]|uniref:MetQ/NlpA family ABC transporter substrate-binding protein n=1 Tax=Jeotgalibaca sp. A127 TaxID=3457324 RepID=UPI003FCFEBFC